MAAGIFGEGSPRRFDVAMPEVQFINAVEWAALKRGGPKGLIQLKILTAARRRSRRADYLLRARFLNPILLVADKMR